MSAVIPFDYEGQPVQFNADGWLNATKIAKRFGKDPYEWRRLPDTEAYLKALSKALGSKYGIIPELPETAFVQAKRGKNGGTWLHPKLAVAFARWLSPDFAVWCDLQIDALLHGDFDVKQRFEIACRALESGKQAASTSGRELAAWRWTKPELEHSVEYWLGQLQLTLQLDAA